MGTWKFLVQREGIRSWTVLEGETMALQPGRYRIAARAPLANTPIAVEIVVTQSDGERRTYQRGTRTNDDGLLAVIPFTDLGDGDWTLTCQAIGDRLGEESASISWQVVASVTDGTETAAVSGDLPAENPSETVESVSEEPPAEPVAEVLEAAEAPEASIAESTVEVPLETALSSVPRGEVTIGSGGEIEPGQLEPDQLEPEVPGQLAIPEIEGVADVPLEASDAASVWGEENGEIEPEVPGQLPLPDVAPVAPEAASAAEEAVGATDDAEPESVAIEAESAGAEPIEIEPTGELAEGELTEGELAEGELTEGELAESELAENELVEDESTEAEPAIEPAAVEVANEVEGDAVEEFEGTGDGIDTAAIAETSDVEEPELAIADAMMPDADVPEVEAIEAPPTLTQYDPDTLTLQLDRTSFTIEPGGTLTLSGCVKADASISPDTRLGGLHLRLRLREPQSLQILVVKQYLLPPTAGGELRFERSLPLPQAENSKLVLGELLLCDTVPNTVAKQSFTIASGLESLLENLNDRQQRESAVWQSDRWSDDRPSEPKPTAPPLLPGPPKPKLDLPGFVASGDSGIDKSQLLARLGLAPEGADDNTNETPDDALEVSDAPDAAPDLALAAAEDELAAQRRAATEGDRAPFEPLTPPSHHDDRFVSRLNQFARDDELAGWLDGDDLDLDNLPEDLASGDLAPLTRTSEVPIADPNDGERDTAREIVLDRAARPAFRNDATPPSARPVLPADTEIPSPDLRVPPGQLTAGRSILVRARLPELNSRVYVKLWIFDRQNQALLDGPRWLTDFLPLDDGTVEGMVNLTVPYGGLDVQFEAIAVEVETDRESYKAAVERRIIPAAPPTLPLENRENRSLRP